MDMLTEDDDDLPEDTSEDIIPVTDEDEEQEDERLAQSEDDSDEEISSSSNRDRRRKRREIQKKARDAAQRELAELRQTVAHLSQRLSQTETQTATAAVNSAGQTIHQQLAQAMLEVQQAEQIIAAATEAGNGQDVVAAMRIRDQAISHAQQLQGASQQVEAARHQVNAPRVDPNTVNYAKEWMAANPWYDPQGRDTDSAVTKAIDNQLAQEGYNPSSRLYWEELTSRVADAINGSDGGSSGGRRKGPPTGNTREHAPVSTKREMYVTAERKQAMIEAGVWDDPKTRQRYLKAYQAYDNGSAR